MWTKSAFTFTMAPVVYVGSQCRATPGEPTRRSTRDFTSQHAAGPRPPPPRTASTAATERSAAPAAPRLRASAPTPLPAV